MALTPPPSIGSSRINPGLPVRHDGPAQASVPGRVSGTSQSTQRFGMTRLTTMARQVKQAMTPRAMRRPVAEHIPMVPTLATPEPSTLNMQLEGDKLSFGDADRHTSQTEKLLASVLNKGDARYQALGVSFSDGAEQWQLTDTQNRLVHAEATPLAVSVFKSSENRVGMSVLPPGDAVRGQLTGVHKNADGQAFRIHEKKLYALQGDTWQAQPDVGDLKSLHDTGGGELHVIDEAGKVRPLRNLTEPLPFLHKVLALTQSGSLSIALTQTDDKQLQVESLNRMDAALHGVHTLALNGASLNDDSTEKPLSILAHNDQLLLSTASGKLMQTPLPALGVPQGMGGLAGIAEEDEDEAQAPAVGAPLNLQPAPASPSLQAALGQHRFGELFTDQHQTAHVRVKDTQGNEHACTWDATANHFQPGWNLSQALVLDRQRGLPPLAPAADAQIQLPRGLIARHADDLVVKDARTGEWKKSSEKDIKSLQAGRDGFAYLIDKDGKLKQLKVAPQSTAHDMGKGIDLTLPGRGTEAKGTILRGAEHLEVEQASVQNDQRYMTLSAGVLRLHDQNGERATLPTPPGNGNIDTLGNDGKDWFVFKDNALYQLSGDHADPKKMGAARTWQAADRTHLPPNAVFKSLHTDSQGRLAASIGVTGVADRTFIRDRDGQWAEPAAAVAGPARAPHAHYQQLADAEPDFTRRGNLKTSFGVLGRNNIETAKVKNYAPNSLTQNYVTAHLASTGAFKVPADSVQHAWKGREGLRPVYDQEAHALQRLGTLAAAAPAVAPAPVATRLPAVTAGPQTPRQAHVTELSELVSWFHDTVAEDLHKTLRDLAQSQGALLRDGRPNMEYRAGKPPAVDLLHEVSQVLHSAGIGRDHPLGTLIHNLQQQGFTLDHRNPTTGIDNSRKRGDDHALLKGRLAVAANVLHGISEATNLLATHSQNPAHTDFARFATDLAALHNTGYEGHPVKRYTDAGFSNYAALEASYDSTKSLLKYMRKDNHPVKRNLLEGLQSQPDDLTRQLTTALRDLEPRESLKINRNYGGGVTAGVTGPVGDGFIGFRGAVDPERTYGVSFTRFDRGLKVSMNREGAIASTASLGFGGGLTDTHTTPGDSHKNIQSNSAWFGGSLDAKHKYTDNTALSFFIRDDELEAFMADLLQTPLHSSKHPDAPGVKPMELMDRGVEKEVRSTGKHNFDLELNANIESRTNDGQTDAAPVAGFMRFGVGLLFNLALLNAERERTAGRGSDGLKTDIYSQNSARFLEKGSVAGFARLFSTIFTSRPNDLFVAGGAPIGVVASLAFDNKTGKTYDVRFKDALAVHASDLKTLESSLEKAFPELKQQSTDGRSIEQRLNALRDQYQALPATDDAQHSALISLAQTRRQHSASEQGSGLMSLMDMVVKHNNVNRIDHAAATKQGVDLVKKMFGQDANPGNAERIHDMMNADPQLKALLDELKSGKGTTRAEIKMEVNDSVKERIEESALNGDLTDAGLKNQLSNRDNLRIKSIAVFRTATKEDSLGLPLPYVNFKSASALSIERLRGEVTFDYGLDPLNPKKFTLDGELADAADHEPTLELGTDARGMLRPR